jgi:ABC-type antimicrobial peptide transport system permease subunit
MSGSETPPFGFVLLFLLFSLLFFWNSYKLWFKTDEYNKSLYNSLTREPSVYPFRNFFLKWMENKHSWLYWQKAFSLLGIAAVIAADVLVVMAYLG